jgi:hypothetical protein
VLRPSALRRLDGIKFNRLPDEPVEVTVAGTGVSAVVAAGPPSA